MFWGEIARASSSEFLQIPNLCKPSITYPSLFSLESFISVSGIISLTTVNLSTEEGNKEQRHCIFQLSQGHGSVFLPLKAIPFNITRLFPQLLKPLPPVGWRRCLLGCSGLPSWRVTCPCWKIITAATCTYSLRVTSPRTVTACCLSLLFISNVPLNTSYYAFFIFLVLSCVLTWVPLYTLLFLFYICL